MNKLRIKHLPVPRTLPLRRIRGLRGHEAMGHGTQHQRNDVLRRRRGANETTARTPYRQMGSGSEDARSMDGSNHHPYRPARVPSSGVRNGDPTQGRRRSKLLSQNKGGSPERHSGSSRTTRPYQV